MMGLLSRIPIIGRFFRSPDDGPVSLVMLLDREPKLGVVEVGAAVRNAFPNGAAEMLGELPGPPGGPPGKTSTNYMFTAEGYTFGVLIIGSPYMPNQEEVADGISRPDIADAVRTHRGWVSIDAFGPVPQDEAHAVIGRVAAALLPEGCLALYMPHRQRFSFPGGALRQAMLAGDWLDVFDGVGSDPVVGASADDAELRKAAEEARVRFPEFAIAFESGDPDSDPDGAFSVKAPFEENGQVEHMWVAVEELLPGAVRGVLGNDPRFITKLRSGDEVTIPLDEIEDWMILEKQGMRGGFSIRVLQPDLYEEMKNG